MKTIITIILVMLFNSPTTFAQIKTEEINKIAVESRTKFGLPAVAIVTMNSQKILHSCIKGVRVINTDSLASINDYFHIGSCSKSILAILAAKLIEQNKISWSTNFFDVYPELREKALKVYHNITLEDLFLCKAGIKAYTSGEEKYPELTMKSEKQNYEFASWLVQQTPVSKPENGKFKFHYSNASYAMASLMLEKVSNHTYEELIDKFIVNEMGIETFIGFPNKLDSKQPWGHVISSKKTEIFPPNHEYCIPKLIIPAGDLSMKPEGFAKYVQYNLKGLKKQDNFIKSESYNYIHYSKKGFSIGVSNSKMSGIKYSGMDGSAGTFYCRAVIVPEQDFAFIIMTNAGNTTGQMKAIDWITMKIAKRYNNWWWKLWL